jgi:TonB family protein
MGQPRDEDPAPSADPPGLEDAIDPSELASAENAAATSEGSTTEAYQGELPTEEHLTRLETQIEFIDLVKERRLEEALPLAEAMVPLTEAEFGSPSAEMATALNNLALIQFNLDHFEDSKASFLSAIEMFREVEGPFTESIITPLVSLGANYHATGDYPQALGLFQEARTVNRRSFGLLNPDQVEIVYHIAATLASMHRYEEAHLQQEDALRLMERVHGSDTMEFLPYIYRYAEWLISAFQFEPARVQYVRVMDIIRASEGPDSPALIKPLTEIGNSYRTQKLAEGRGISALKRALEIAEAQPDPDELALARVLRDIGDWYTAFSRIGATGEEYLRAWELLGNVEDGESIRDEWFADPDYVLREYPSTRGLAERSDAGAVEGYVRVTFDVDAGGQPLNVTVLESDPPEFKDDTMMRAIRRSRFRPRVVDGELAYSTGLIRNFTFYYVPEE